MRRSHRPLIIASRKSRLARIQAEWVGQALQRLHPKVEISFQWIESEGDQRADIALADAGGKGLFAKAIEQALLNEQADLAVHSLKDLPARGTKGLLVAATPKREDPRDCLIAPNNLTQLNALPKDAIIGTASPRRGAQLKRLRPDLQIKLIRGNIETRLRKVLEPKGSLEYHATLMAMSGLKRAGLEEYAQRPIDPVDVLPAAGQGALALQCRASDHVTIRRVLPLNDPDTSQAVEMERRVVEGLNGDCHSPIAVFAEPVTVEGKAGFRMRARVLSPNGWQMAQVDQTATGKTLRKLAKDVLEQLREQGCASMLAE